MTYDHAQAPRIGQPTPVESPGIQLVTQETLPEVGWVGRLIYLLDIDEFRVFDGVAWQVPTAAQVGGAQQFSGPTAPVADAPGDLWMNTTNYQLYVWDGTNWVPVVDPQVATLQTALSQAQATAESALSLATGKTTVWYTSTQPVAPGQVVAIGDLWVNTVTNRLYKFDTLTTVTEIQDKDIADALSQAGTAQATADEKIQTFYVQDPPTGLGVTDIGDLWFETDAGNKPWRWSGTGWVALPAGQLAIQLGAINGQVMNSVNISSSVITGNTITGNAISGNTITGGTVTGGTVQTAATGNRVQLSGSGGYVGSLHMFGGAAGETFPGEVNSASYANYGMTSIKSPSWGSMDPVNFARLVLDCLHTDSSVATAHVQATNINMEGSTLLQRGRRIAGLDFGFTGITTDSNGYYSLGHAIGQTPDVVICQIGGTGTNYKVQVTARDASTFQIRAINSATNSAAPGVAINLYWLALQGG